MTEDTAKARQLLADGDIKGLIRQLRFSAEGMPSAELAAILAEAGRQLGDEDIARTGAAVAADAGNARALYDFGYACVGAGIAFAAIPPLKAALALAPSAIAIRNELVAALEREGRHAEAAGLLTELPAKALKWVQRYLLVYNLLMAGDVGAARDRFGALGEPEDEQWGPAARRVGAMMDRLEAVRDVTPLDDADLRGWQFVLGGTLLGTLSPYGFGEGMRGRYAFLQDGYPQCRRGVERLRLALEATGASPDAVGLLPDRDSRILGLATARLLGLPAQPFDPGRPDTLVVAYDLSEVDGDTLVPLKKRTPGQVLFEHANCWTDSPAVTADISTLLHRTAVAPWGELMRRAVAGGVETLPADARPEEELAELIVDAVPEDDADVADDGSNGSGVGAQEDGDGDGGGGREKAPLDTDELFTAFAADVRGQWLRGDRERLLSSGPVRSSRFL
jgi:hypothetical protein